MITLLIVNIGSSARSRPCPDVLGVPHDTSRLGECAIAGAPLYTPGERLGGQTIPSPHRSRAYAHSVYILAIFPLDLLVLLHLPGGVPCGAAQSEQTKSNIPPVQHP